MAYNPYSAVNSIYKLKGQWDEAHSAGDTTKQNEIAENAKNYYKQLRDNGYKDVADELEASGYAQAKAINDKWAKTGRTATRDYFYSLGQSKGMSKDEVDGLIEWDNQTCEVSFGGRKIGAPDAVVDGVSYWSDTSVLDNAFNDYISRSGHAQSNSQLQAQHNTEIKDKVNQLWGTQASERETMAGKYDKLENTAYSNPFTTDEAKAILAKYDLAGLRGRDNAAASGGASNGGNIDSYAAANALRQQASLINMGQSAVLDAYNNRINNVKGILESLGVYQQNQDAGVQNTIGLQQTEAQRLFENDETAKNNETARLSEQASVSGYTPSEWVIKNNDIFSRFLNSDGTFKKEMEGVDIQALINQAKASGDTKAAQDLAVVRTRKMLGNYEEYGQYLKEGDTAFMSGQRTEEGNQFDETMNYNYALLAADQAEAAAKGTTSGRAVPVSSSSGKSSSSKSGSKPTLTAAQARDAIKAGVVNQTTVDAYNYYYGGEYTVENPPPLADTGSTVDKNVQKNNIDATLSHWLYSPWADFDMTEEWKAGYSDGTHKMQYIAAEKMKDPETRSAVKAALAANGYGENAGKKLDEYENEIAIEIAKIEGRDYQDKEVIAGIKKRYGWS